MAPPTGTLTVLSSTPHSAILLFESSAAGAYATLKKSGATGGDVDLTSFRAGPLRACLDRAAQWDTLTDRIRFRMIVDGVHPGTVNSAAWAYSATGYQSAPSAVGVVLTSPGASFTIATPVGASLVILELVFIPSNQR